MQKFTIAVLVKNEFGVLNRVTSMFRRRQFNIASLTVSETEKEDFSRITVTYEGTDELNQHIITQLCKLPDICSVKELKNDGSVSSELMLIKVKNTPDTREDIRHAADAFKAETVDYASDSVVMRLSGESKRLDAFQTLMNEFMILEICRTGIVSMQRGSMVLKEV